MLDATSAELGDTACDRAGVRHVKLLDAERFETPAGRLKQRGAAHASKADDNCVVHHWFLYIRRKPDPG